MIAYDILTEKEVIIPSGTSTCVNNTFVSDGTEYIVILISNKNIEVMPLEEYIKRVKVAKSKDGEYRTLKEIEEEE